MKFRIKIFVLLSLCIGCDLKFQETTSLIVDERAVQLTKDTKRKSDPAWSPDGSMIAYSSYGISTDVFSSSLEGDEVTEIAKIEDDIRGSRIALSPNGTKLAFYSASRRHLWVFNLQTREEFLLTPDHPFAFDPAWSPDGEMIAFSVAESGTPGRHIWIIPASGGNVRQVTGSEGRDLLPSWSPDSKKIAFESLRNDDQIWVVDIDAGNETQLTSDSTSSRAPTWSPDGATIAFYTNMHGRSDIWTIPAEGGQPTQLTNNIDAYNPSWSPDGTKIAYRTSEGIWVSSPSGEVLSRTNLFELYPLWQPDNQSLIGTVRTGVSNIEIFLLDDSLIFSLTEQVNGQFDSEPAWYPDSKKIVFARRNSSSFAGQTLWTKSILGGAARPLIGNANRSGSESNPDISPDGRWLAYDDRSKIFIMPLPNGSAIDLSPFIGEDLREPDWAPNSQGIICNYRNNLKIFTTDSSLVVEDKFIPGSYADPVWSAPHPVFGENIAATGIGGIYVMQLDGSNIDLTISGGNQPAWSPDGSKLAFIKNNQVFVSSVFIELKN